MNLWVDADGVLSTIQSSLAARSTFRWEVLQPRYRWRAVESDPAFLLYLPLTPFAHELWDLVSYPGHARMFLDVIGCSRASLRARMGWAQREFKVAPAQITFTSPFWDKSIYCTPGDILLSAYPQTTADWTKAGGYGMLVPQAAEEAMVAAYSAVDIWRRQT